MSVEDWAEIRRLHAADQAIWAERPALIRFSGVRLTAASVAQVEE